MTPEIQISTREIVEICREFGARDPKTCYWHVEKALRAARDPVELFENYRRNRPDLFWRN
jgi:hypothetical protein